MSASVSWPASVRETAVSDGACGGLPQPARSAKTVAVNPRRLNIAPSWPGITGGTVRSSLPRGQRGLGFECPTSADPASAAAGVLTKGDRQPKSASGNFYGPNRSFALDRFVHFLAMHGHMRRGLDSETHLVPADVDDRNHDIVANHDAFIAVT